jgi:hypothetical protein
MGGTFMSLSAEYRDYFIRNLHDALSGHTSSNVEEAIKYSEQSLTKCIGITIETRPDYCLKPHLSNMLSYGCTRLEIGVQSIYEDVARDTNRHPPLFTLRSSLHSLKHSLLHYTLHFIHFRLFTSHSLFTSHCSLHFTLLSSLHIALFTSHCSLHFTLLSSLHIALFILFTLDSSLHSLNNTLYFTLSLHFIHFRLFTCI